MQRNRSERKYKLGSYGLGLLVLFATFSLLGPPLSYAQGGKATINGVITDPSGAVVPGAKITLTNKQTGYSREVVSGSDGSYNAPFLPVGEYSIAVSHEGFKSETRTGILLTADQVATMNLVLSVGQATQTVEVKASAEQISTNTGAISQVVNERSVVELPLNGRNPAELAFQAPGAVNGLALGGPIATPGSGSGMPTETAASVNGSRMGGVYYMLDGANNMDSYFMSANPFPNSDATQEFRVLTNNFDAQYGFAPGAVVSIVTKSGTNNWRGDAFEFLRNNHLNSADFFTHIVDPLKRNQFGASEGGPIVKDKLFIFGNYQGTIERISIASSGSTVPSNAMLNGDFSALLPGIQLHDANGNPYPNNYINPSLFSPVALNIEKGMPRTSDPLGNVILSGRVQQNDTTEFTTKTDYFINDRNHLSFRSYFQNFNRPAFSGNGDYLISDRSWVARNQNYSGNYVWSIRPNVLNSLEIGYNRVNSATLPGLVDTSGKAVDWTTLGSQIPSPLNPPTIGLIATDGFWISQIPVVQRRHSWIINDTVSYTRGPQMIVAGVNVLTEYSLERASWLADPMVFFNDSLTGSYYSDFLLGNLSQFEQGGGEYNSYAGIYWAGFGQDSIRLKPNLTVNMGLRWEPYLPPQPQNGRMAIFWPGHQSTRYPNAPQDLVYPGDPGAPAGGWFANMAKFAPRLSVAWQPKALANTTIRSAFGIFDVPYDFSFYNHDGSNAPFSPTFDLFSPSFGTPGCQLNVLNPWSCNTSTGGQAPFPPFSYNGGPAPPSTATFALPVTIPATFDPHYKIGTDQSWNLSVEHQFKGDIMLRAAYVGREDYHLTTPLELNPGYYSAGGARLKYPNFSSILSYEPNTTASYNALQFTFEKRFSHGLQFTSNYTWSKQIDSSSLSTLSNTGSIGDPFDISWNRGISDLNVPQNLSTYWVYEEPSLHQYGKVADWVLGSWEIAGIWDLHSGIPFSIAGGANNSNNSGANVYSDRADVVPGQRLNVHQGSEGQWLNQYFNTKAFKPNAPGTFGNSARNVMQGPGFNNADLLFAKNFPFKERYRVQFRWEMFNAFNRPQFGTPNNNPISSQFGKILSTFTVPGVNASRVMQGALKLYW